MIDYDFTPEDAERFAFSIGARVKKVGGNLSFSACPYCKGGSHRDKYTFGISLKDGRFKCQRSSCAVKGNMITLAKDFGFELSDSVSAYFNINNFNGKFKKFRDSHRVAESTELAIDYLDSRGISKNTAAKYEITTKGNEHILVFPFKDEAGALTFIKYRNMDFKKGESFGSKEWCEANCKPILFGMNHCNFENKTLVMTEGQMDSLSLAEAGIENAVSVPTGMNGFTWIPHCWDFVQKFEKIVIFGDCENGNITLLAEIKKRFKKSIYHVRVEDYRGFKDANELLNEFGTEYLQECVKNAVQVALPKVVCLADVEDEDVYSIPKIKTGFKTIDKMLVGGIPFGGVTLITGKPGEGKSTLASQILLEALDAGYKCFAYSGELPNYLFKNWISLQAAGLTNIQKTDAECYINADAKKKIDDWYRDKLYLYDNQITAEEEESDLISIIENVIVQYGVQVVMLDNLMTGLSLDGSGDNSDKYERQSRFCKRLTRLAIQYGICVLLVAHKRKNNVSANENDEIAGSGDIANLAILTLSFKRDREKKNWSFLKINKNRLFGEVNNDSGVSVYYFPESRRLAEEGKAETWNYGWDADFKDVNCSEIPF